MLKILNSEGKYTLFYDVRRQLKGSREVKCGVGTRNGFCRKIHHSAHIHAIPQTAICLLNCISYSKDEWISCFVNINLYIYSYFMYYIPRINSNNMIHKLTNAIQQLPLWLQLIFPNKMWKIRIWSLILIHISIKTCPSTCMNVAKFLKPETILTLSVWCSCASNAVTSSCKVMTSRNCPQSAIKSEQSWARFILISSASSSGFSIFWS